MPEPRLVVRVGDTRVGPAVPSEPVEVHGDQALQVRVEGLRPDAEVVLEVGNREVTLRAAPDGRAVHHDVDALRARAGRLRIALADPLSEPFFLQVLPTKLAESSLRALLHELDEIASGLAADLGGRTGVEQALREGPEAMWRAVDEAVALIARGVSWIRRKPLHHRREQVAAVAVTAAAVSSRDARWLATHPAAALRARALGRPAGVLREEQVILDVPENRGVLDLLDRLLALLDDIEVRLDHETGLLEQGRAARQSFRTSRSSLFEEMDRPRLQELGRRRDHLRTLRDEVHSVRRQTGLPLDLRREPIRRTPSIETHPGYWSFLKAAERIADVGPSPPPLRFVPVDELDTLYERWCVVQVVKTIAAYCGVSWRTGLQVDRRGWFVEVPRGEVFRARHPRQDRTIRVLYEPVYAWRGEGAVRKLHPGRPWRPDVVVEVQAGGHPVELHVFDAKHRLAQGADQVPRDTVRHLWWKYAESIGWRDGLPAVASIWALYPGTAPGVWTPGPAMLEADWPQGRVRGGAIAARPGVADGALGHVVGVLLG